MQKPWEALLGDGGKESFPMRLLLRRGEPFLLLPENTALAAKGLALYAAQSRQARVAKTLLRMGLQLGIRPGLQKTEIRPSLRQAFATYLKETTGSPEGRFPEFALLAGNPRVEGRRCVLLLFDGQGTPRWVVKAGAGGEAARLIAREADFLQTVPASSPAISRLQTRFSSGQINAWSMDFLGGDSPAIGCREEVAEVLGAWLRPAERIPLGELAPWKKLESATGNSLPVLTRDLPGHAVAPALFHGDFAPWNIRVKDGAWTTLDWERGELCGVPLWDWLHFIIQPAVLVERKQPLAILESLENLFRSECLVSYSKRAGIENLERSLVSGYLQYCIHVLAQTEGLRRIEELAQAAGQRWTNPR